MRILLYDNNYLPRDVAQYPRWWGQCGRPWQGRQTGWRRDGTRFVHDAARPAGSASMPDREPIDWLEYHHRGADRDRRLGPVSDFIGYNGSGLRGENPVNDLMLDAKLACGPDVRDLMVRIHSGGDCFLVTLPLGGGGSVEVQRSARSIGPTRLACKVHPEGLSALGFDPIDYEDPAASRVSEASPIALGVRGGSVLAGDLKLYRDVHYTNSLAYVPRRPFGVESPYLLGVDEYFVLGDNSPVSNDSRFWTASPVVPGELFLGKPFLVHLPGHVVPLQVFGRSLYWVPDPREIRYIR
jgi:signal peptidase I